MEGDVCVSSSSSSNSMPWACEAARTPQGERTRRLEEEQAEEGDSHHGHGAQRVSRFSGGIRTRRVRDEKEKEEEDERETKENKRAMAGVAAVFLRGRENEKEDDGHGVDEEEKVIAEHEETQRFYALICRMEHGRPSACRRAVRGLASKLRLYEITSRLCRCASSPSSSSSSFNTTDVSPSEEATGPTDHRHLLLPSPLPVGGKVSSAAVSLQCSSDLSKAEGSFDRASDTAQEEGDENVDPGSNRSAGASLFPSSSASFFPRDPVGPSGTRKRACPPLSKEKEASFVLTRKTCGSPICCTQRWLHRAFAEALVRLIERHVKKKKKALGVVIKNKRKEEERGRTGSGGGDCVATPYGDDDDDADEEEEALEERENEEVLFLVLQLLRTLCHMDPQYAPAFLSLGIIPLLYSLLSLTGSIDLRQRSTSVLEAVGGLQKDGDALASLITEVLQTVMTVWGPNASPSLSQELQSRFDYGALPRKEALSSSSSSSAYSSPAPSTFFSVVDTSDPLSRGNAGPNYDTEFVRNCSSSSRDASSSRYSSSSPFVQSCEHPAARTGHRLPLSSAVHPSGLHSENPSCPVVPGDLFFHGPGRISRFGDEPRRDDSSVSPLETDNSAYSFQPSPALRLPDQRGVISEEFSSVGLYSETRGDTFRSHRPSPPRHPPPLPSSLTQGQGESHAKGSSSRSPADPNPGGEGSSDGLNRDMGRVSIVPVIFQPPDHVFKPPDSQELLSPACREASPPSMGIVPAIIHDSRILDSPPDTTPLQTPNHTSPRELEPSDTAFVTQPVNPSESQPPPSSSPSSSSQRPLCPPPPPPVLPSFSCQTPSLCAPLLCHRGSSFCHPATVNSSSSSSSSAPLVLPSSSTSCANDLQLVTPRHTALAQETSHVTLLDVSFSHLNHHQESAPAPTANPHSRVDLHSQEGREQPQPPSVFDQVDISSSSYVVEPTPLSPSHSNTPDARRSPAFDFPQFLAQRQAQPAEEPFLARLDHPPIPLPASPSSVAKTFEASFPVSAAGRVSDPVEAEAARLRQDGEDRQDLGSRLASDVEAIERGDLERRRRISRGKAEDDRGVVSVPFERKEEAGLGESTQGMIRRRGRGASPPPSSARPRTRGPGCSSSDLRLIEGISQALCSTSLSPADVISLASCLPVDVLPDLHPVLQLHVVNTCSSSPSSSPSFPPLLSLGEGAGLEREDPFPGRRACASLLRSLEQAIQNQHRASLYSEPTPNSDHLITSSLFQQPSPHTASSSSFFFPLSSSSSPPASIAVLPALLTVTNAALEHLRKAFLQFYLPPVPSQSSSPSFLSSDTVSGVLLHSRQIGLTLLSSAVYPPRLSSFSSSPPPSSSPSRRVAGPHPVSSFPSSHRSFVSSSSSPPSLLPLQSSRSPFLSSSSGVVPSASCASGPPDELLIIIALGEMKRLLGVKADRSSIWKCRCRSDFAFSSLIYPLIDVALRTSLSIPSALPEITKLLDFSVDIWALQLQIRLDQLLAAPPSSCSSGSQLSSRFPLSTAVEEETLFHRRQRLLLYHDEHAPRQNSRASSSSSPEISRLTQNDKATPWGELRELASFAPYENLLVLGVYLHAASVFYFSLETLQLSAFSSVDWNLQTARIAHESMDEKRRRRGGYGRLSCRSCVDVSRERRSGDLPRTSEREWRDTFSLLRSNLADVRGYPSISSGGERARAEEERTPVRVCPATSRPGHIGGASREEGEEPDGHCFHYRAKTPEDSHAVASLELLALSVSDALTPEQDALVDIFWLVLLMVPADRRLAWIVKSGLQSFLLHLLWQSNLLFSRPHLLPLLLQPLLSLQPCLSSPSSSSCCTPPHPSLSIDPRGRLETPLRPSALPVSSSVHAEEEEEGWRLRVLGKAYAQGLLLFDCLSSLFRFYLNTEVFSLQTPPSSRKKEGGEERIAIRPGRNDASFSLHEEPDKTQQEACEGRKTSLREGMIFSRFFLLDSSFAFLLPSQARSSGEPETPNSRETRCKGRKDERERGRFFPLRGCGRDSPSCTWELGGKERLGDSSYIVRSVVRGDCPYLPPQTDLTLRTSTFNLELAFFVLSPLYLLLLFESPRRRGGEQEDSVDEEKKNQNLGLRSPSPCPRHRHREEEEEESTFATCQSSQDLLQEMLRTLILNVLRTCYVSSPSISCSFFSSSSSSFSSGFPPLWLTLLSSLTLISCPLAEVRRYALAHLTGLLSNPTRTRKEFKDEVLPTSSVSCSSSSSLSLVSMMYPDLLYEMCILSPLYPDLREFIVESLFPLVYQSFYRRGGIRRTKDRCVSSSGQANARLPSTASQHSLLLLCSSSSSSSSQGRGRGEGGEGEEDNATSPPSFPRTGTSRQDVSDPTDNAIFVAEQEEDALLPSLLPEVLDFLDLWDPTLLPDMHESSVQSSIHRTSPPSSFSSSFSSSAQGNTLAAPGYQSVFFASFNGTSGPSSSSAPLPPPDTSVLSSLYTLPQLVRRLFSLDSNTRLTASQLLLRHCTLRATLPAKTPAGQLGSLEKKKKLSPFSSYSLASRDSILVSMAAIAVCAAVVASREEAGGERTRVGDERERGGAGGEGEASRKRGRMKDPLGVAASYWQVTGRESFSRLSVESLTWREEEISTLCRVLVNARLDLHTKLQSLRALSVYLVSCPREDVLRFFSSGQFSRISTRAGAEATDVEGERERPLLSSYRRDKTSPHDEGLKPSIEEQEEWRGRERTQRRLPMPLPQNATSTTTTAGTLRDLSLQQESHGRRYPSSSSRSPLSSSFQVPRPPLLEELLILFFSLCSDLVSGDGSLLVFQESSEWSAGRTRNKEREEEEEEAERQATGSSSGGSALNRTRIEILSELLRFFTLPFLILPSGISPFLFRVSDLFFEVFLSSGLLPALALLSALTPSVCCHALQLCAVLLFSPPQTFLFHRRVSPLETGLERLLSDLHDGSGQKKTPGEAAVNLLEDGKSSPSKNDSLGLGRRPSLLVPCWLTSRYLLPLPLHQVQLGSVALSFWRDDTCRPYDASFLLASEMWGHVSPHWLRQLKSVASSGGMMMRRRRRRTEASDDEDVSEEEETTEGREGEPQRLHRLTRGGKKPFLFSTQVLGGCFSILSMKERFDSFLHQFSPLTRKEQRGSLDLPSDALVPSVASSVVSLDRWASAPLYDGLAGVYGGIGQVMSGSFLRCFLSSKSPGKDLSPRIEDAMSRTSGSSPHTPDTASTSTSTTSTGPLSLSPFTCPQLPHCTQLSLLSADSCSPSTSLSLVKDDGSPLSPLPPPIIGLSRSRLLLTPRVLQRLLHPDTRYVALLKHLLQYPPPIMAVLPPHSLMSPGSGEDPSLSSYPPPPPPSSLQSSDERRKLRPRSASTVMMLLTARKRTHPSDIPFTEAIKSTDLLLLRLLSACPPPSSSISTCCSILSSSSVFSDSEHDSGTGSSSASSEKGRGVCGVLSSGTLPHPVRASVVSLGVVVVRHVLPYVARQAAYLADFLVESSSYSELGERDDSSGRRDEASCRRGKEGQGGGSFGDDSPSSLSSSWASSEKRRDLRSGVGPLDSWESEAVVHAKVGGAEERGLEEKEQETEERERSREVDNLLSEQLSQADDDADDNPDAASAPCPGLGPQVLSSYCVRELDLLLMCLELLIRVLLIFTPKVSHASCRAAPSNRCALPIDKREKPNKHRRAPPDCPKWGDGESVLTCLCSWLAIVDIPLLLSRLLTISSDLQTLRRRALDFGELLLLSSLIYPGQLGGQGGGVSGSLHLRQNTAGPSREKRQEERHLKNDRHLKGRLLHSFTSDAGSPQPHQLPGGEEASRRTMASSSFPSQLWSYRSRCLLRQALLSFLERTAREMKITTRKSLAPGSLEEGRGGDLADDHQVPACSSSSSALSFQGKHPVSQALYLLYLCHWPSPLHESSSSTKELHFVSLWVSDASPIVRQAAWRLLTRLSSSLSFSPSRSLFTRSESRRSRLSSSSFYCALYHERRSDEEVYRRIVSLAKETFQRLRPQSRHRLERHTSQRREEEKRDSEEHRSLSTYGQEERDQEASCFRVGERHRRGMDEKSAGEDCDHPPPPPLLLLPGGFCPLCPESLCETIEAGYFLVAFLERSPRDFFSQRSPSSSRRPPLDCQSREAKTAEDSLEDVGHGVSQLTPPEPSRPFSSSGREAHGSGPRSSGRRLRGDCGGREPGDAPIYAPCCTQTEFSSPGDKEKELRSDVADHRGGSPQYAEDGEGHLPSVEDLRSDVLDWLSGEAFLREILPRFLLPPPLLDPVRQEDGFLRKDVFFSSFTCCEARFLSLRFLKHLLLSRPHALLPLMLPGSLAVPSPFSSLGPPSSLSTLGVPASPTSSSGRGVDRGGGDREEGEDSAPHRRASPRTHTGDCPPPRDNSFFHRADRVFFERNFSSENRAACILKESVLQRLYSPLDIWASLVACLPAGSSRRPPTSLESNQASRSSRQASSAQPFSKAKEEDTFSAHRRREESYPLQAPGFDHGGTKGASHRNHLGSPSASPENENGRGTLETFRHQGRDSSALFPYEEKSIREKGVKFNLLNRTSPSSVTVSASRPEGGIEERREEEGEEEKTKKKKVMREEGEDDEDDLGRRQDLMVGVEALDVILQSGLHDYKTFVFVCLYTPLLKRVQILIRLVFHHCFRLALQLSSALGRTQASAGVGCLCWLSADGERVRGRRSKGERGGEEDAKRRFLSSCRTSSSRLGAYKTDRENGERERSNENSGELLPERRNTRDREEGDGCVDPSKSRYPGLFPPPSSRDQCRLSMYYLSRDVEAMLSCLNTMLRLLLTLFRLLHPQTVEKLGRHSAVFSKVFRDVTERCVGGSRVPFDGRGRDTLERERQKNREQDSFDPTEEESIMRDISGCSSVDLQRVRRKAAKEVWLYQPLWLLLLFCVQDSYTPSSTSQSKTLFPSTRTVQESAGKRSERERSPDCPREPKEPLQQHPSDAASSPYESSRTNPPSSSSACLPGLSLFLSSTSLSYVITLVSSLLLLATRKNRAEDASSFSAGLAHPRERPEEVFLFPPSRRFAQALFYRFSVVWIRHLSRYSLTDLCTARVACKKTPKKIERESPHRTRTTASSHLHAHQTSRTPSCKKTRPQGGTSPASSRPPLRRRSGSLTGFEHTSSSTDSFPRRTGEGRLRGRLITTQDDGEEKERWSSGRLGFDSEQCRKQQRPASASLVDLGRGSSRQPYGPWSSGRRTAREDVLSFSPPRSPGGSADRVRCSDDSREACLWERRVCHRPSGRAKREEDSFERAEDERRMFLPENTSTEEEGGGADRTTANRSPSRRPLNDPVPIRRLSPGELEDLLVKVLLLFFEYWPVEASTSSWRHPILTNLSESSGVPEVSPTGARTSLCSEEDVAPQVCLPLLLLREVECLTHGCTARAMLNFVASVKVLQQETWVRGSDALIPLFLLHDQGSGYKAYTTTHRAKQEEDREGRRGGDERRDGRGRGSFLYISNAFNARNIPKISLQGEDDSDEGGTGKRRGRGGPRSNSGRDSLGGRGAVEGGGGGGGALLSTSSSVSGRIVLDRLYRLVHLMGAVCTTTSQAFEASLKQSTSHRLPYGVAIAAVKAIWRTASLHEHTFLVMLNFLWRCVTTAPPHPLPSLSSSMSSSFHLHEGSSRGSLFRSCVQAEEASRPLDPTIALTPSADPSEEDEEVLLLQAYRYHRHLCHLFQCRMYESGISGSLVQAAFEALSDNDHSSGTAGGGGALKGRVGGEGLPGGRNFSSERGGLLLTCKDVPGNSSRTYSDAAAPTIATVLLSGSKHRQHHLSALSLSLLMKVLSKSLGGYAQGRRSEVLALASGLAGATRRLLLERLEKYQNQRSLHASKVAESKGGPTGADAEGRFSAVHAYTWESPPHQHGSPPASSSASLSAGRNGCTDTRMLRSTMYMNPVGACKLNGCLDCLTAIVSSKRSAADSRMIPCLFGGLNSVALSPGLSAFQGGPSVYSNDTSFSSACISASTQQQRKGRRGRSGENSLSHAPQSALLWVSPRGLDLHSITRIPTYDIKEGVEIFSSALLLPTLPLSSVASLLTFLGDAAGRPLLHPPPLPSSSSWSDPPSSYLPVKETSLSAAANNTTSSAYHVKSARLYLLSSSSFVSAPGYLLTQRLTPSLLLVQNHPRESPSTEGRKFRDASPASSEGEGKGKGMALYPRNLRSSVMDDQASWRDAFVALLRLILRTFCVDQRAAGGAFKAQKPRICEALRSWYSALCREITQAKGERQKKRNELLLREEQDATKASLHDSLDLVDWVALPESSSISPFSLMKTSEKILSNEVLKHLVWKVLQEIA